MLTCSITRASINMKGHKRKHNTDLNEAGSSKYTKSPYFSLTDVYTKPGGKGNARLPASFFNQPCQKLAKSLLGQQLVRLLDTGERLSGTIVETEAYLGPEDSACHTYQGHRSNKVEAMYMVPGTCYVYLIYGMYNCLNISSQGVGQAVLIRALEPKQGLPTMRKSRDRRRKNPTIELKLKDLCSGPGKLTEALAITKSEMNRMNLSSSTSLWLEEGEGEVQGEEIVACPRIGVNYATPEWVKKPLRFYTRGNSCVSKRDREAEQA